jgi:aspartate kinase
LHSRPEDAKTWDQIKAERSGRADVDVLVSRLRDDALEALTLTGISVTENQARITIHGVPDQSGIAAEMFETIGDAGIFVDMIVQGNDGEGTATSISFTVDATTIDQGVAVARQIQEKHSMGDVQSCGQIAKVTVSGIGLRSHTHVATKLFDQLAAAEINVEMINTSELQVNAVIQTQHLEMATNRLREAFSDSLR